MSQFTFEERTENESPVVVARPAGNGEPVKFDGSVAERGSSDELKANWEPVIEAIARDKLGNELTISDGRGVIDREEAAKALVESGDDLVTSEYAAEALLEYLADPDQGVLELDENGAKVIVLKQFDDIIDADESRMLNNWAATLDTCVGRIEAAVERVTENKETLEKHIENGPDPTETLQQFKEKKGEIKQEMAALLAGRSPSELPKDKRREFRIMRERYHRYELLAERIEDPIPGNAEIRLGRIVDDLESIKEVLMTQSHEFRTVALANGFTKGNAAEMVDNLTGMVATLSEATEPKEKMREQSDDEFASELFTLETSVEPETVEDLGEEALLQPDQESQPL